MVLNRLALAMPDFYSPEDQVIRGIESDDRQGNKLFYPYCSLSVGVVRITPIIFTSHHEVVSAMSYAKKQAKKSNGIAYFTSADHETMLKPML